MTDFDKKIRELSRNVNIPKGYDKRINEELYKIPKTEKRYFRKGYWLNKKKLAVVFCLICIAGVLGYGTIEANANIFDTFKFTILDLFHIGEDDKDLAVESKQKLVESKQDVQLEMREVVTDHQGMYLLVKITAPPDITFNKDVGFEYFAFCEGENYNADKLIGGARDCYFIENMEEKPNVAIYVMNLTADMDELEGKNITAYFKDLTLEPNGENPQLLVEGMWSITFLSELTVKEDIEIEGKSDMVFPFVNSTATVEQIELTPLGMSLLSDISKVPYEDLGISDSTIAIRLKMIDGSEKYLSPYVPDKDYIVDTGSIEYDKKDDRYFQKNLFSFSEMVDITKVVGIYIQDLYVPVE